MANQTNNNNNNDKTVWFVPNMLAAAFVVPQYGADTFEPMEGLKRGTIYPELYMPYVTRRERK